jgi:hypothetical protein
VSHGNARTLAERFWRHVVRDPDTECWIWTGGLHWSGYGRLAIKNGPNLRAHRVAYELLVGPIPEGLDLDHVKARGCERRDCCNPAHLEPVTRRENLLRGETISARNAAKTHCPAGHPYTTDNTYYYQGRRSCATCVRERVRKARVAA